MFPRQACTCLVSPDFVSETFGSPAGPRAGPFSRQRTVERVSVPAGEVKCGGSAPTSVGAHLSFCAHGRSRSPTDGTPTSSGEGPILRPLQGRARFCDTYRRYRSPTRSTSGYFLATLRVDQISRFAEQTRTGIRPGFGLETPRAGIRFNEAEEGFRWRPAD